MPLMITCVGASMRGESSIPGPIDYYIYMNSASVAVQLSVLVHYRLLLSSSSSFLVFSLIKHY